MRPVGLLCVVSVIDQVHPHHVLTVCDYVCCVAACVCRLCLQGLHLGGKYGLSREMATAPPDCYVRIKGVDSTQVSE